MVFSGAGMKMLGYLRGESELDLKKTKKVNRRCGRIQLSDGSWVYAFED